MKPAMEEQFEAAKPFLESEWYDCPEYERAIAVAGRVSDILMECCGSEVARLMEEYIGAEMEMMDMVNSGGISGGLPGQKVLKGDHAPCGAMPLCDIMIVKRPLS